MSSRKSTFPNIKAREREGERIERTETSSETNARLAKRLRQLNRQRRRIERRNNVMQWAIQEYAKLLGEPLQEDTDRLTEVGNSLRSLGESIIREDLIQTNSNRQFGCDGSQMIFDSVLHLESCIFCPKSFLTKNQKDDHVMTHLH